MTLGPTDLSSCDFVDENPVMRQYSDITDGVCSENVNNMLNHFAES